MGVEDGLVGVEVLVAKKWFDKVMEVNQRSFDFYFDMFLLFFT